MGSLVFWLLMLVVVLLLFGGCGRGWLRRGGGQTGWCGPAPQSSEPAETPKQILDCRLAKGEISLEEYRRLLKELSEG
jgi:uncharacterized membrane protein